MRDVTLKNARFEARPVIEGGEKVVYGRGAWLGSPDRLIAWEITVEGATKEGDIRICRFIATGSFSWVIPGDPEADALGRAWMAERLEAIRPALRAIDA